MVLQVCHPEQEAGAPQRPIGVRFAIARINPTKQGSERLIWFRQDQHDVVQHLQDTGQREYICLANKSASPPVLAVRMFSAR